MELGDLGKYLIASSLFAGTSSNTPEEIMNWCRINNEKYTDHDFSTSILSLTHLTTESSKYKNWSKYTWHRVSEISPEIEIFKDTLSPLDIVQGALGDCNFLCSLSILCEYPGLLQNIFVTKTQNNCGVYSVKLCADGIWKDFIIDDFFPCGANKVPVFSQCVKGEIWVMIMEKIWAKRCGSYENTEKTELASCLRDLTGAPTRVLSAEIGIWDDIVQCKDHGYIVAASAGNTKSSHALLETVGLIGSISYAVLKTADVSEKIIQLRNPWSKVEWNGDWSDNSSKWTSRLKKKLNHQDSEDGTFWMSFSDFCEYFSTVSICEYTPESVYSSSLISHEIGECIVVDIEIQKSGEYVLSLNQKDKVFQDTLGPYSYSQVRLIVCREGRRGIEHLFGKKGNSREVWSRLSLRRGTYKVLVLVDWACDEREIVISAYGPQEALFRSTKSDLGTFLEQIYVKKADEVPPVDYGKNGFQGVYKYHEFLPEGFGYIYIKNTSQTIALREKTYFKVFKNLRLLPPFKESSYEAIVNPGQSCFILIKVIGEGEYRLESTSTYEKLN